MLLAKRVDEQCRCKLIACTSEISQDFAKCAGWNYEKDTESTIEGDQRKQAGWYSSAHLRILAFISLYHGTVSGCEMDSFWIEYSQRLASGVTLTHYSCCWVFIPCCWPSASLRSRWSSMKHLAWTSDFSLQICLCCAELLAKTGITPGW